MLSATCCSLADHVHEFDALAVPREVPVRVALVLCSLSQFLWHALRVACRHRTPICDHKRQTQRSKLID